MTITELEQAENIPDLLDDRIQELERQAENLIDSELRELTD